MSEAMYWSEIAELTHAKQVEQFNFCTCEEGEEFPYDDCPRVRDCAPSDEWEWKDCDIEGHDTECYRQVCPSCGDTMNRDCEDKL